MRTAQKVLVVYLVLVQRNRRKCVANFHSDKGLIRWALLQAVKET